MADTVVIAGEGGVEQVYDLPLPEPIAERLAAGQIRLVDGDLPEPDAPDESEEEEVDDADEAPAGNASQAAWAEYAVSQGMDPEEAADMSRDDLVAHFSE